MTRQQMRPSLPDFMRQRKPMGDLKPLDGSAPAAAPKKRTLPDKALSSILLLRAVEASMGPIEHINPNDTTCFSIELRAHFYDLTPQELFGRLSLLVVGSEGVPDSELGKKYFRLVKTLAQKGLSSTRAKELLSNLSPLMTPTLSDLGTPQAIRQLESGLAVLEEMSTTSREIRAFSIGDKKFNTSNAVLLVHLGKELGDVSAVTARNYLLHVRNGNTPSQAHARMFESNLDLRKTNSGGHPPRPKPPVPADRQAAIAGTRYE